MSLPRAPHISLADARASCTIIEDKKGDLVRILKKTGKVGVDGSGGKNYVHPSIRCVGAGFGVADLDPIAGAVISRAQCHPAVPGKQTVPRAECYAMLCILKIWDGTDPIEIICDATYSLRGLQSDTRLKFLRGGNGDPWKLVYDELDKKAFRPSMPMGTEALPATAHAEQTLTSMWQATKVKSHASWQHLLASLATSPCQSEHVPSPPAQRACR